MKKLLLFFGVLALLNSCSTEFDINAPYKETMVIHGLLNPLDSVQYIRISKAFLGEGNALIMAQQPDSFNYADILDVKLERLRNNALLETISLQRDESIPKDDGVFAAPFQVYYKTNRTIFADGSLYRLTVTNRQTGVTATSLTRIVGNISVQHPTASDADFASPFIYTADFIPGENSKVFDMVVRFHYSETDSASNITTFHQVDMNFPDQVAGQNPLNKVDFKIQRADFWPLLGASIPVKAGVVRRVNNLPPGVLPVEYRFIVGTEDLYTYQQLQQPSSGVAQDRPQFTTVENGAGLFSSRLIRSEFRNLNTNTRNAFDTSAYTRNLNFSF